MPPVTVAAYLVNVLDGAGWREGGGFSPSPLSPLSLLAWCQLTRAELGPIDAQDALDASRIYISALNEYDGKPYPCPYIPELTPEEEEALIEAERQAFERAMGIAPDAGA